MYGDDKMDEDRECGFCGEDLEEETDVVKIAEKVFCCQDHASKWKNAEGMDVKLAEDILQLLKDKLKLPPASLMLTPRSLKAPDTLSLPSAASPILLVIRKASVSTS